MSAIRKKKNWKIIQRTGVAIILIVFSNIVTYNFLLPPNSTKKVFSPEISGRVTEPFYILLTHRNQFIDIESECVSCDENVKLNITIIQILSDDYLYNKTIKEYSFEFSKINKSSLFLNPSFYLFEITFQGNFSVNLQISGFGIPNYFLLTNFILTVFGVILIILDKKLLSKKF
jgi:hypothetical protein